LFFRRAPLLRAGAATYALPNITSPTTIDVPLAADVPAGTKAIAAEIHVADGQQQKYRLFIGVNTHCGNTAPRDVTEIYPNDALPIAIAGHVGS
jgi:hypothetical protein